MQDNIISFPSKQDFHRYLVKQIKTEIGEGSEGIVYLTHNNETIKEMFINNYTYPDNNILMASDVKLDSFLFPKKLFLVNNCIIGYTADYSPNIFKFCDGDIHDIDLIALVSAGYKMIRDIKVLTDMKYVLYDMPNNLLFDGKSLKAIDTLQYFKKDTVTLKENINILRHALINALDYHDEYCSIHDKDNYTRILNRAFK